MPIRIMAGKKDTVHPDRCHEMASDQAESERTGEASDIVRGQARGAQAPPDFDDPLPERGVGYAEKS